MSEEKEMPGYMTYREAALMFTLIGLEDAAAAIQATCNYYLYGTLPELKGAAAQVFEIQKASIDRGRETYRARVEGGKKGGNAHWHKDIGDL